MTDNNQLKNFVGNQFPQIFREDGETLVKFIEYYYEWLQQEGNPIDIIRKINYYRDVDRVPERFYTFLRGEFMKNLPQNLAVDETILYKNIKNFYRAKGSESAFKLLFKILYNEDISFYYPADDIFRSSDGHWIVDKTLIINPNIPQDNFNGFYTIRGETSKASARFEKIVSYIKDNYQVFEIYLSYIDGNFVKGEKLFADGITDFIGIVDSNGVITKDGYYEGTYGFLSSDKYLQDNHYYQEFSYVIKSSKTIEQYQDVVKKLVHPAGLKMFGSIEIEAPIEPTYNGEWRLDNWHNVISEHGINYNWTGTFDFSSASGSTIRQIDIDYWAGRLFTNTIYNGSITGVSYQAFTYSYFGDSRNILKGANLDNIMVGDVIAISGEFINNYYDYKVVEKISQKRVKVAPRFETQSLQNGKIDIYRPAKNENEIPYSSITTKKLEDKLVITEAPKTSLLREYLDDHVVDIFNIAIHEFDSGRVIRSKRNQFGVLAESRIYNVKTYDDIVDEHILTNEDLEAIANEENKAIYVDTYPVNQNPNIFVKQYSKKYALFSEKITDINEVATEIAATPVYVLINNTEIALTDEDGNDLTTEVDFDIVSFV